MSLYLGWLISCCRSYLRFVAIARQRRVSGVKQILLRPIPDSNQLNTCHLPLVGSPWVIPCEPLSCIGAVSAGQIDPHIGYYCISGYTSAVSVHKTKVGLRSGISLMVASRYHLAAYVEWGSLSNRRRRVCDHRRGRRSRFRKSTDR